MNTPEFLKPRLRLFLSADIVGSTALKQSRFGALPDGASKAHGSWFSVIQGFYIESQQAFLKEWQKLKTSNGSREEYFGEDPRPWKTIGDEVLFVKILSDYRQVAVSLKCWMEAVKTMRAFVRREDARLDVKCTAWIAGFPFKNKEVVLGDLGERAVDDYFLASGIMLNEFYKDSKSTATRIDYIGPSIDIGFRLASLSTSRRFIVSIDVAYILSLTMKSADNIVEPISLYYYDSVELKGVFGGLRYPVFWIDLGDGPLPRLEDALTGQEICSRDHVTNYCEQIYKSYDAYTFRPFIESASEQQLRTKPAWYDDVHGNLIKNFSDSISTQGAVSNVEAEPRLDTQETSPPTDEAFNAITKEVLADLTKPRSDSNR